MHTFISTSVIMGFGQSLFIIIYTCIYTACTQSFTFPYWEIDNYQVGSFFFIPTVTYRNITLTSTCTCSHTTFCSYTILYKIICTIILYRVSRRDLHGAISLVLIEMIKFFFFTSFPGQTQFC